MKKKYLIALLILIMFVMLGSCTGLLYVTFPHQRALTEEEHKWLYSEQHISVFLYPTSGSSKPVVEYTENRLGDKSLEYEWQTEAVYLSVLAEKKGLFSQAKEDYAIYNLGVNLGFLSQKKDLQIKDENHLLQWGTQSSLRTLHSADRWLGFVFLAWQDQHVIMISAIGPYKASKAEVFADLQQRLQLFAQVF